jgi:hypothetical protein
MLTVVYLLLLASILACIAGGDAPTATSGAPQVCGDGICADPETAANCLADCTTPAAATATGDEAPSATDVPTATSQPVATVKTTLDLNVRFGPSADCQVLGSFPSGTEVQVLAKDPTGQWWQVPWEDGVGWCMIAYTTPVTDTSGVPTQPGPYCAPAPTATPVPPTSTPVPVCGNGIVEEGEQCDGNNSTCPSLKFCSATCKCEFLLVTIQPPLIPLAVCGDGTVNGSEVCDPPDGVCGTKKVGGLTFPKFCSADCMSCN